MGGTTRGTGDGPGRGTAGDPAGGGRDDGRAARSGEAGKAAATGAEGEDFDTRLRAARARHDAEQARRKGGDAPETKWQAIGFALRVGSELVTATVVGVGIGWLLDWWLGTTPWLMVLFLFLGGGAGVMSVYRLVEGQDQSVGWRRPGDRGPGDAGDDEDDKSA